MAHNPMGDGWTDDPVFENSWLTVAGSTTVTYLIVQNEGDESYQNTNEGYWSTSETGTHDPSSTGYTAGPTSPSIAWKAGFDRTSTKRKFKKGFVRFLDVQ